MNEEQGTCEQTPARHIQRAALYHRAGLEFRYAGEDGCVTIRLKSAAGNLNRVELCHGCRYERKRLPNYRIMQMDCVLSDGISDWHEARLKPEDPRLFYFFRITGHGTHPEILYFQESGLYEEPTLDNRNQFFCFPYIQAGDIHKIPTWSRGAVIYQVFPDRFLRAPNTGTSKTADGRPLKRWGTIPHSGHDLYGGNLEGIRAQIPYMKSLGIDVLYMTPVFRSGSAHRYDTDDYFEIDPMLGTKQDLRALSDSLHAAGMKLVLDAVFNHCGPGFFVFRDVLEKGASSRYADWFHLEGFPVDMQKRNYATFAFAPNMPKLNAANPEVAAYFREVGRFWIREADIDGWRIDVANEVDPSFWPDFRKAVKAEKPEALLIGEIWGDSHFWLRGDMFDSVMHYPFMFQAKDHFAGKCTTLTEMDHRLNRIAALYPHPVRDALWTMLDSHDTERFYTATGQDVEATRMAAFLQFAFPGSPMVYYGAEIGMQGGPDPDCRRCMEWGRATDDNSFLQYYRKLGAARSALPALKTGSFRTVSSDDGLYAFLREMTPTDATETGSDVPQEAGDRTVLVLLNTNVEERVRTFDLPASMRNITSLHDFMEQAEILHHAPLRATVRIPGKTGALLTAGKE